MIKIGIYIILSFCSVSILLRGVVQPDGVVQSDSVLYVRGCHVRVCGVRCEQIVSPFGNGVGPEIFARIAPDIYDHATPGIITRCVLYEM